MAKPMHTSPEKRKALAAILAAYPGNSCEAQRQRIRAALGQFSVTTYEIMRYLDCYDPRPRVFELRKAGDRIDAPRVQIETESGKLHRVGLYVLVPGGNSK